MPLDRIRGALDLSSSVAVSALRMGYGIGARPTERRPPFLLELYEYEACPYCRLVREALTELDLDAIVRPCPRGGERFRPRVRELGGREQFPYLVDPNTGTRLYESADIVRYLFDTYGDGLPLPWRLPGVLALGSSLAGLPRTLAGRYAEGAPGPVPDPMPELYSFEGSPFARLVRERLCELEVPWILRSVGRTTASDWVPPAARERFGVEARPTTVNRRALLARAGRLTVPYLVDPQAGVELGDSTAILEHVERRFGAG
jgi:glutathione S-transferase